MATHRDAPCGLNSRRARPVQLEPRLGPMTRATSSMRHHASGDGGPEQEGAMPCQPAIGAGGSSLASPPPSAKSEHGHAGHHAARDCRRTAMNGQRAHLACQPLRRRDEAGPAPARSNLGMVVAWRVLHRRHQHPGREGEQQDQQDVLRGTWAASCGTVELRPFPCADVVNARLRPGAMTKKIGAAGVAPCGARGSLQSERGR